MNYLFNSKNSYIFENITKIVIVIVLLLTFGELNT
jgi:hypothetical protein